jgi:ABC-type multidrug transport system permease subunit
MTTWGRAFRAASDFIIYSIIWIIVGGAIMFAGYYFGYELGREPNWGILIGGIIVGYIILVLGPLASMFKILSEITADEVEKRIKSLKT